jgi:HEPN domain-containing protein
LREDADYEDFIDYSKNDAEEALDMAREFIEKLSTVIEETRRKI